MINVTSLLNNEPVWEPMLSCHYLDESKSQQGQEDHQVEDFHFSQVLTNFRFRGEARVDNFWTEFGSNNSAFLYWIPQKLFDLIFSYTQTRIRRIYGFQLWLRGAMTFGLMKLSIMTFSRTLMWSLSGSFIAVMMRNLMLLCWVSL